MRDGERAVYIARAAQIPWTLRELGRLRELTFREAREGTGKSCDLDDFDQTYLHMFSYDQRDQQIVGAYRLGLSDQLAIPNGLYTSTLFELSPELFRRTGPAIEMGRSFVCARYQRSASGLFLLWRGIGRFLSLHPQYRVLFGPVSISADYSPASRELMVDFVMAADRVHALNRYVRPRTPFARVGRTTLFAGLGPGFQQLLDIEEVSQMVADVEPDQKGVPVLFRQYLRLGGKLLGFNVDARFSGVLDGLVLVDLTETDPKILARYLGADAARLVTERPRL
ncbi:MAG: GNAT family N-acyltransferase [Polyangiaceae bacterium]